MDNSTAYLDVYVKQVNYDERLMSEFSFVDIRDRIELEESRWWVSAEAGAVGVGRSAVDAGLEHDGDERRGDAAPRRPRPTRLRPWRPPMSRYGAGILQQVRILLFFDLARAFPKQKELILNTSASQSHCFSIQKERLPHVSRCQNLATVSADFAPILTPVRLFFFY